MASEERVEEVAGQGLGPDLVITGVEVDWLFQAKGMDALEAFPLNLDLLGVGEVGEGHA